MSAQQTYVHGRENVAPVTFVRCLVHRQLVGLDGEGRLLGRCWGCIRESANAIAKIEGRA